MTATPERADGLDVLRYFDGRIAAELRVWDAIDQQYLVPFSYFGVHDGTDLTEVPWKRGTGYDPTALTNVLTADHAWARRVVEQLRLKTNDPHAIKALGFCVTIAHARFMAEQFRAVGIPAVAVWGDSPMDERTAALRDLDAGRVNVVFTVDLFNEGVDVPNVDTLLLLRPTESPTLFLQQLGRGLRRARGKALCTVLDFVGNHRREFRFDRRLRALLGGSRRDVERQVENDFPFLPAGCHMELDPVAREIVLRSIREAIPSDWKATARRTSIARRRLARHVSRGDRPRTRGRLREQPQLERTPSSGRLVNRRRRSARRHAPPCGRTTPARRRPREARRLQVARRTRQRTRSEPLQRSRAAFRAHARSARSRL